MSLDSPVVPENKEVLKKGGGKSKGHKNQPEGAPQWPNLEQFEQLNK